jgi:hypothetical protein
LRIYIHTYYYIKDQNSLLLPTNNTTTQNSQSTEVNGEERIITDEQSEIIKHPKQVALLPLAALMHIIGSVAGIIFVNKTIG